MALVFSDIQYYCVCIGLWIFSTLVIRYIFKKNDSNSHLNLPPCPPDLPLIGHLHYFSPNVLTSLQNLADKYGSLLRLKIGGFHFLHVSSATVVSEFYKTNDLVFASRPKIVFADDLPYGEAGFFMAPYGDYWMFIKKLCMTELLSARQLEKSRGVRREERLKFLNKMFNAARKGQSMELAVELMKLTNNSSCRMLMSTGCSEEDNEAEKVRALVKECLELGIKVFCGDIMGRPLKKLTFWLFGREAVDVTNRFDELLEKIMKRHEEDKKKGVRKEADLMDMLLDVYADENAELKISRKHIKAFLVDLFIGGTSTSEDAMQWIMANLINHPEAFRKVREEVDAAVGKRLVEEADIPNMPYLQAVVKETLRLYPPLFLIMRECTKTCQVKGYDIPEKTAVAFNFFSINRDPEAWDEPNEFKPERFMKADKGNRNVDLFKEHNLGYVPFGGGRRLCPGMNLAYAMVSTTVAAMVQCFNWEAVSPLTKDGKVDMKIKQGNNVVSMAKPLVCRPHIHFDALAA